MKNYLSILLALLSLPLIAGARAISNDTVYSWETQHAKVLPNGDLEWAPKAFKLEKGNSVRYIDFENGDDTNDGQSVSSPWKHHPWDNSATGNAKNSTGIDTYIFKRGVVYRGKLSAKESGTQEIPLRLTSDPEWGTGEAGIYGSVRVEGGWTKADSAEAPNIPNPEMVWYKDIPGLTDTKTVCEIAAGTINRVRVARIPNYYNTPEEPMQKWWAFTAKKKENNGTLTLTDTKNLVQTNPDIFNGGVVWATEDAIVMCALWKQPIDNYDPEKNTINVANQNFGGVSCKYFIENTPHLLDTTNEFYYDNVSERMYLRLDGDKDPNTTVIEIANKGRLIDIFDKSNIEISALTFGFTTHDSLRSGNNHPTEGMPAIKLNGACSNIIIKNCKFQYVNGSILANGSPTDSDNTIESLTISDNEMNHIADFSILINGTNDFDYQKQGIYLKDINILRNKISHNGERHLCRNYSSIPTVQADIITGEVAGNILEYCWGGGLNIRWGKDNNSDKTIPFIRGFVHHNKVSHSLIGVNDYGGIESWQGGPAFYYNNVSFDASGFKYNWNSSLGYAIYLDGSFKNYVFNNIAYGKGWNLNSAGYMHVLGYYNMWVHNDAYNVGSLTYSGNNKLAPDGQNYYLANVSDSTKMQFNHTTRKSGIPFESYGNNFFSGNSFQGTFVTNKPNSRLNLNFQEFVDILNSYTPDLGQVGFETSKRVFENPSSGDFRPTENSELIDRGVKFFIPFPLSSVVGEWHFYKHNADSSLIKGENFYFTEEFIEREKYKDVPKNHLEAYGISDESFLMGELEDWAEGALVFDGEHTYCELTNDETSNTICNNVDMTTNSFILEGYFKTLEGQTSGCLLSKYGDSGYGYRFDIDEEGNARFNVIDNDNIEYSLSGSIQINDGDWHHVLVEVNRQLSEVSVYIDGVLSNGISIGMMPAPETSLTNSSDLLIGKNKDNNFFAGAIDFIRISKGTLADAKTTIDELYKWEFNGPFLSDFAGNEPIGKRDAGALEKGTKLCNMTINPIILNFDINGDAQHITINAENGFEVVNSTDTFFTYTVEQNGISVTIPQFIDSEDLIGEIWINGCNKTQKIIINKLPKETSSINNVPYDIKVMPNPVNNKLLYVLIPDNLYKCNVTIIDMLGKVKYKSVVYSGENKINSNFAPGIYLLNFTGTNINFNTKVIVK